MLLLLLLRRRRRRSTKSLQLIAWRDRNTDGSGPARPCNICNRASDRARSYVRQSFAGFYGITPEWTLVVCHCTTGGRRSALVSDTAAHTAAAALSRFVTFVAVTPPPLAQQSIVMNMYVRVSDPRANNSVDDKLLRLFKIPADCRRLSPTQFTSTRRDGLVASRR